ncbi:MAG: nucleotide sugar dehydrogenase [Acidobacteriota bacterium]|nr:nucleotide sugar dehydrogenase [Acidobacteriota bacterium]OQB57732.1 MAG: UDP-N-acetyl-D-glucosamine 6-dehydrogenase [Candidatus Aminicenantes bacterium ADurb.Bin147]HNQ79844.1 nucleotide sugar dehydrogenase [Candidatus Aminicenantes bacterium]MDD8010873.1 nucleotide sugar dehydrogenase [Acidobacteriota bacterium]MDD8029574.1 nucleotide sugar dehydrogenase [Acidobacteriota bacterium]
MNTQSRALMRKIKTKEAAIGVVGLGYVGLPLVKAFLNKGFKVTGFDVDRKKVRLLNKGQSYIKHVTATELKKYLAVRRFEATDDFSRLKEMDAILICVPTPLDAHRNPDLSFVLGTTETIAAYLRKGQLVILESTTYPGTTDEEMLPILERKGLKGGKDFFLAFSPERENPGDPVFSAENTPKVVGGLTPDCLALADALYSQVVAKTVPVSSTRVAESAKLLENIFRSVNIALVNELKLIFERMDIDVWEVIRAASSKPFGFMPFYPGPGLGGHCIPIDPFYLTWKAREVDYQTKFIELAGEINTKMPYYVVNKTMEALAARGKSLKGSRILVLGIAYKKNIDDQRESPSLKIISILRAKDVRVEYNDPYVPESSGHREYPGLKLKSVPLTAARLRAVDAVIIATDHSCYDYDFIVKNARLVIDTRNAVKTPRKNVIKA